MENQRGPFLSNPFVARAARWGLLAWSIIGLLILLYLAYRYVLYPIRIVFAPLVVALIVIYVMGPVIDRLQARGIPRVWGTLLTYVVFLGAVGLALAYLIAAVSHQVTLFVRDAPNLLASAQHGLGDAFARLGVHVDTAALVRYLEPNGTGALFLGRLASFTSGVVQIAFVLLLGPLIAFYLLVDLPKIQRAAQSLVPASRRREVSDLTKQVGDTLGGFFRSQLLVALAIGLSSMLLFFVIGLPFFALLGALTGLFALVPLIGTVVAAVPVLFVSFTSSHHTGGLLHVPGGWRLALASTVVLVLVQQLDTRLLSPRLLSRQSRLNPVTVLLSLLVGGTLLGLWGMLLAVPIVAAVKVVVLYFWDTRSEWPPRASERESGQEPGQAPTAAPEDRVTSLEGLAAQDAASAGEVPQERKGDAGARRRVASGS